VNKLLYIRARHLRVDLARWQTHDPLWPMERPYTYCNQTPTTYVDPSGLSAGMPPLPVSCSAPWNDFVIRICFADGNSPACQYWANQYYNACVPAGKKPPLRYNPIKDPVWNPVHGVGVVPVYPPPNCGDVCGWQYSNDSWPCFQLNPPQPGGSGIPPNTPLSCVWNLVGGNIGCLASAIWKYLQCQGGCGYGNYAGSVDGPLPEPGDPGTILRGGSSPILG
jgi:hypothetical protein